MNQKWSTNIILIILVVVLAGVLGYVVLVKKPIVQNDEQTENAPEQTSSTNQENATPILSEIEALALVKTTWGDCPPLECSQVVASVTKQGSIIYVTATYEGLRDDSQSAERKTAVATYGSGKWTLGEVTVTQQCWPGRGHQDYSSEPCI